MLRTRMEETVLQRKLGMLLYLISSLQAACLLASTLKDMEDCRLCLIQTLSATLRTEARAPNAYEKQFQPVYQLYCPITDYIDHLEQGLENVLHAANLKIIKLSRLENVIILFMICLVVKTCI